MIIEIGLGIAIIFLIGSLVEHRKELKVMSGLIEMIKTYDKSDKVIKDCVVYTQLPINIKGKNLSFIGCRFEHLNRKYSAKALDKILGIRAKNEKDS